MVFSNNGPFSGRQKSQYQLWSARRHIFGTIGPTYLRLVRKPQAVTMASPRVDNIGMVRSEKNIWCLDTCEGLDWVGRWISEGSVGMVVTLKGSRSWSL